MDVGRDPRAPAVDLRGRHPLRHDVVEARHDASTGVSVDTLLEAARPAARRRRTCSRTRHTGYTTNLPLADVTGGKAWVVWEVDGEPLPAAARRARPACSCRTSTSGRARSGSPGLRAARPRRARVLGAQRLPRPRRPLARAALPGRLMRRGQAAADDPVADGDGRRDPDETARGEDVPPRARRSRRRTAPASTTSSGSPRPTATPRQRSYSVASAPDGTRTRSSSPSSGSTTARSRRSCTTWSWSATSSRCAARSAAGSCGTATRPRCSSAAARASCRSWRCCGCARATGRADLRAAGRVGADRPTTSTTPTSCRGPRRPSSTRVGRRRALAAHGGPAHRRRPRAAGAADDATAYVCGSPGSPTPPADLLVGARRAGAAHPRRALRPHRLTAR